MKTKLSELTMSQFIELVCGDLSVLKNKHEVVNSVNLALAARAVIFEYRNITDSVGVRSYLRSIDDYAKVCIEESILCMCHNCFVLGEIESAVHISEELGIRAGAMSELRLRAEIKSRLERSRRQIREFEEELMQKSDREQSDIRTVFDSQTARLMTHFKFQIDTETVKASIYAHLVSQYEREIKARIAALKKK